MLEEPPHAICVDEIEGEYDLHDEYGMIQVQLVLYGLDYSGDNETETVEDSVFI